MYVATVCFCRTWAMISVKMLIFYEVSSIATKSGMCSSTCGLCLIGLMVKSIHARLGRDKTNGVLKIIGNPRYLLYHLDLRLLIHNLRSRLMALLFYMASVLY